MTQFNTNPTALLQLLLQQQTPQPQQQQGFNLAQAIPLALARAGEIQAESSGLVGRGGFGGGGGTSRLLAGLFGQQNSTKTLTANSKADLIAQQLRSVLGLGESKDRSALSAARLGNAQSEAELAGVKGEKLRSEAKSAETKSQLSQLELDARQSAATAANSSDVNQFDAERFLRFSAGGDLKLLDNPDFNDFIKNDIDVREFAQQFDGNLEDPDVISFAINRFKSINDQSTPPSTRQAEDITNTVISRDLAEKFSGAKQGIFRAGIDPETGALNLKQDRQKKLLELVMNKLGLPLIKKMQESGEFDNFIADIQTKFDELTPRDILRTYNPELASRFDKEDAKFQQQTLKVEGEQSVRNAQERRSKNKVRIDAQRLTRIKKQNEKVEGGNNTVQIINPDGKIIIVKLKSLTPQKIQQLKSKGFVLPGIGS